MNHRDNLRKLANYLRAMPKDYAETHFLMSEYAVCFGPEALVDQTPREAFDWDGDYDNLEPSKLIDHVGEQYACGTCACAVGHGPAAGIPVSDRDGSWNEYAERVFGVSLWGDERAVWHYLFGPDNPDDPQAAADRIDNYLAGGDF